MRSSTWAISCRTLSQFAHRGNGWLIGRHRIEACPQSSAFIARRAFRHSSVNGDMARQAAESSIYDRYAPYFQPFPEDGTEEERLAIADGAENSARSTTAYGFLGKTRRQGPTLSFNTLNQPGDVPLQLVFGEESQGARETLATLSAYSPVVVHGFLSEPKQSPQGQSHSSPLHQYELRVDSIRGLNEFPKDIIVSKGVKFPPTRRHLQMRFDASLRNRLRFRQLVGEIMRASMSSSSFQEVETPTLFKSTPEGAREFLVPTRRPGLAYALPQSPQQYKQILMASGVWRYFQFARCYRDEDLRADRQPEFTQLDLEMSFASGKSVRRSVEQMLRRVFSVLARTYHRRLTEGVYEPVQTNESHLYSKGTRPKGPETSMSAEDTRNLLSQMASPRKGDRSYSELQVLPVVTYQDCMAKYGIDKPDLRIPFPISRVDNLLTEEFVGMITKLNSPVVEAARLRLDGTIDQIRSFAHGFMESVPKTIFDSKKSGSTPGVFVFDPSKPLNGLSAMGHEAATNLSEPRDEEWEGLEPGDVIIVHARPNEPFRGEGSTELGRLRKCFFDSALAAGLLPGDLALEFRFLWVTEFPLFTPDDAASLAAGEGQGGKAGFKSTHHPFTAPLSPQDFRLLETDPLAAKGDHYDLVCNGWEVGGGSTRIHVAAVQEHIMRDILKMPEAGIEHFRHLLDALHAGCPPHAGFALGFDRLVAIIAGADSIRDVIAFPKTMKGEDAMVHAPGPMTTRQLDTYHLASKGWKASGGETETA